MPTFMQYALAASSEALDDAAWRPKTDQQREMTVSQESPNVKKDDPAKLVPRAYVWAQVLEV